MAPADKVSLKPWLKRINNFDRIIWSLENDLNLFRIWPYRNPSLKMTHTIWIISKKSAKTYKFSKFRMWETDLWWVLVEWFAPECNFDLTWPVFTEKKKIILGHISEDIIEISDEDQNFIWVSFLMKIHLQVFRINISQRIGNSNWCLFGTISNSAWRK